MPRKIDFLIIGAQKAGTTALWQALSGHPDIRIANRKEVHFFDKAPPTGLARIDYWLYHRAFDWSGADARVRRGEATPAYLWWPGALERIKTYNPKIKLIALLRDPIERAWSQHWMDVGLGRKGADILESIDKEMAQRGDTPDRVHSLISRGLYSTQIKRLQTLFPASQTLILNYAGLKMDWPALQHRLCGFVDVADQPLPLTSANQTEKKPALDEDMRETLANYFREDMAETRQLLGWEEQDWSV